MDKDHSRAMQDIIVYQQREERAKELVKLLRGELDAAYQGLRTLPESHPAVIAAARAEAFLAGRSFV